MPSPITWSSGPVDCGPEAIGFDASQLNRLEAIFQGLVLQGKAQCASYALSRRGRVFANRSFGPFRYDRDNPMQSGSWRKIASITKVLTSLGVLKLIEDGRLMTEMPLCHVLPEFNTTKHSGIRLVHVLTHTSGLVADPGYHNEPNPNHVGFWSALHEPNWVSYLASLPIEGDPGEKWCYSSAGFALLGEVIARVTKQPYYQWIENEILQPLGMRDTFFDPGFRSQDSFTLVSEAEKTLLNQRASTLLRPFLAAGGAFSTCHDLLKLGQIFLNQGQIGEHRIFGKKTLAAMQRVHIQVPAFHWGDRFTDWQYGLGLEPARHPLIEPGTVWGHEGSGRCAWWFDPKEEFVAAWTLPTTVDWDPDFCWTPRAVLWAGLS